MPLQKVTANDSTYSFLGREKAISPGVRREPYAPRGERRSLVRDVRQSLGREVRPHLATQAAPAQSNIAQLSMAFLETTSDAVAVLDEKGLIVYANTSMASMLGCAGTTLLGQHVRTTGLAPSRTRSYLDVVRTLRQEGKWSGEYDAVTHGGEIRRLMVSVTAVAPSGGEPQFLAVVRDVTHQRRLEYIAEATNLVENVGYLFASLRHELGNPINSIKTAVWMLRDTIRDMPPERAERYLDRVLQEVGRVEYLLKSLRSLSATERPTLDQVPIAQFLLDFTRILRPEAESRGVTLTVHCDDDVGAATADPRALHQVLLNLVTNALDAVEQTPNSRVHISVTRGTHVKITVTDNGKGISPERRSDVFKPFHTTKAKGTGLGLAICRRLITLMRGTIDLEASHEGETTFAVVLDATDMPQKEVEIREPTMRQAITMRPAITMRLSAAAIAREHLSA